MRKVFLVLMMFLTMGLLASPAFAQAENVQALWHLDNSIYDTSGHGHDLTTSGTSWAMPAKFEQGLTFNGSAYAYTTDPDGANNLDGFTGLTLEAWVNPTALDTIQIIMLKGDEAGPTFSYVLGLLGPYPAFAVQGTSDSAAAFSSIPLEVGKWTHLVGTWDGSTVKIYIDGTEDTNVDVEGATSDMVDNATPVVLGGDYDSSVPEYIPALAGTLDEVRIWSRAQTPEEVMSSAQAGVRAVWHFDETAVNSDTTTPDSSGYDNTATLEGEAVVATPTPGIDTSFGQALTLDGVNDYVEVPNSNSLNFFNQITMDAWIYPTAAGQQYTGIVSKGNVGNFAESYDLFLYPSGVMGFLVNSNGTSGGRKLIQGSTPLSLNTWYHVAGTYDGTQVCVFVNGVSDGCAAAGAPFTINPTDDPVLIGESYRDGTSIGDTFFAGKIDEVHVWARALSQPELAFMYNSTTKAPLFIPTEWGETFGSGAVFSSDWHVDGSTHAMVVETVVPDNEGTTIANIMKRTKPKSDAALLGHQESVSDILSLITGNGGFSKGSKTLHLDTTLSDDIKLGSQIQWDPVK